MAETANYGLYVRSDDQANFYEWREEVAGETDSNMTKIDAALKAHDDVLVDKQDKLTGTQGQVVGFDAQGRAVAQEAPEGGVTSFNGRMGAVMPQAGDYTAADVGALEQNPQKIEISTKFGYVSMGGKALQYDEDTKTIACVADGQGGAIYPTLAPFGCDTPTADYHAATKKYVDGKIAAVTPSSIGAAQVGHTHTAAQVGALTQTQADGRYLKLAGGDMTGMIDMQNNVLTGIPAPVSLSDAVNLQAVMNMIVSSATRVKVVFEYAGGHYGDYTTYIPINDIRISGLGYIYTVDSTVSVPRRLDGGCYTTVWLYYILGTKIPGPDWSEPSIITKITLPDGTVKSLDAGRGYYSTTLPTSFQNGNVTISGTMTSTY